MRQVRRQVKLQLISFSRHRRSTESGQAQAGGHLTHFRVGDVLGLCQRLIGSGENHFLDELRVRGIQRLGINLDGRQSAIRAACFLI
jgi:hypothetical protein